MLKFVHEARDFDSLMELIGERDVFIWQTPLNDQVANRAIHAMPDKHLDAWIRSIFEVGDCAILVKEHEEAVLLSAIRIEFV